MDAKHTPTLSLECFRHRFVIRGGPFDWEIPRSHSTDAAIDARMKSSDLGLEELRFAELVVRAVNSHAMLVEACRAALARGITCDGSCASRDPHSTASCDCQGGALKEQLRAALAAAEPAEGRKLSTDPKYANWPETLVPDAEDQT